MDCSLGSVISLGTSGKPFRLTELHLPYLKILFFHLPHLPTGRAVVRIKCGGGKKKKKMWRWNAKRTAGWRQLCISVLALHQGEVTCWPLASQDPGPPTLGPPVLSVRVPGCKYQKPTLAVLIRKGICVLTCLLH